MVYSFKFLFQNENKKIISKIKNLKKKIEILIRKGNSKRNLFWKKSNRKILISSDKSSSNDNNKTVISQQIDLQQRQQELREKILI